MRNVRWEWISLLDILVLKDAVLLKWHERVLHIGINRDAVSVQLPVTRDGDFFPGSDIVVGLVKVFRTVSWLFDPVELPLAVKRFVEGRGFACAYQGCFGIRIRHKCAVCGFFVLAYHTGDFPVISLGCLLSQNTFF